MSFNKSNFCTFKNRVGESYLYSGYTGLIFEWNDRIKNFMDGNADDEEARNYLIGKPLESEMETPKFPQQPMVEMIMLYVTNQCNLTCPHCNKRADAQSHPKEMNLETIKSAILYFLENFEHGKSIEITFFGGDPLLNLTLLKDSIEVLDELEKDHNISFRYSIITNGAVLNQSIIDFLARHNIKVEISIDGCEAIKGFNQTMLEIVKELAEYCDVLGTVKLTNCNLDLIKLYEELEKGGFNTLKLEYGIYQNHNKATTELPIFIKNLQLFADYFIDNIKQKRLVNFMDFISPLQTLHLGASTQSFPCNFGVNKFTVTMDGSIHFCPHLISLPEFQWGDIVQGFNSEKRIDFLNNHELTNRKTEQCYSCWAQRMCGGACYYASYIEKGSTAQISDLYCEFKKQIFEKALYIYSSFLDEEKIFLDNIKLANY